MSKRKLFEKSLGKRPLGRWEDNVKIGSLGNGMGEWRLDSHGSGPVAPACEHSNEPLRFQ